MTHITNLPFLSYERCEALRIDTRDVIASIERLVRGTAEGTVWNAPKSALMTPDGRYMMATLCASNDPPIMTVKSLMVSPDNASRGLESINAAIVVHDAETGLPMGVVDGNWVTAVRTAGLSAVAAKYLARPDAKVVAFVGCGVQARSHLDALSALYPLTEIRALGRGSENRDRLCEHARGLGLNAVASGDAQAAVDGADLVVSSLPVSFDKPPFVDANWLKPGAFCTITDLALPWVADSMGAFDRLVIDDLVQERSMEKPMVSPDLVSSDLTGLVLGKAEGRTSSTQRCAFVFRALAIGDLALATLVWQRHAATLGESPGCDPGAGAVPL